MGVVTLRYWAAARDAASVAEESCAGETLGDALDAARARHADRPDFERVLQRCSFIVDGDPAGTRDPYSLPLREGVVVEVLPPFAGG